MLGFVVLEVERGLGVRVPGWGFSGWECLLAAG